MTRGCGVIRWRIKGTCKQSQRSPKTWSDAKHICCCFVVTTTLSVRSSNVNKQLSSYSPLNPRSWSIPSGRKGLHLPLSLAPSQFECSPSVDKRPLTGELMIMKLWLEDFFLMMFLFSPYVWQDLSNVVPNRQVSSWMNSTSCGRRQNNWKMPYGWETDLNRWNFSLIMLLFQCGTDFSRRCTILFTLTILLQTIRIIFQTPFQIAFLWEQ